MKHVGLDAVWVHTGGNSPGERGSPVPGAAEIEEGRGVWGWCKGREHVIEGSVDVSS